MVQKVEWNMAQKLNHQPSWERFDHDRLANAVAEIARSPNLRFLARNFISFTGVQAPLPSGNALETARAAGRQDAGIELIAYFLTHNPGLWPALILEDINEQNERTVARKTDAGSADRRHAERDSGSDDPEHGGGTSDLRY
jgi:hypothetical protein